MGDKTITPVVITGTMITIAGMLAFATAVVSLWAKPKAV